MPFGGQDFLYEKEQNTMLSRRQINVQRDNLISMCRISVKALLDYACLNTHVDDECEEFINFCAVFEHLVSHRLRPNQKKVWLPGPGSPRHFWDILLETQSRAHSLYFQSCVPNIDAIESFKSPQAKLRAFIRVALMEKRLSDYVMWVLDHQLVLRAQYLEGAVMLSEQASVLCGDLIGLNAIDFNFCLKGNENEFLGPLEISYSRFLQYKQSAASLNSDEIEMLRLNRAEEEEDQDEGRESLSDSVQAGSILTESNVNDILRLQQLERDFRSIKEQKDYLEELARLRERQISETNARLDGVRAEQAAQQREWERERRTMDSCILELQADITKLFEQNERLRFQVASFKQFKEKLGQRDIQMVEMAAGSSRSGQEKENSSKVPSSTQQSGQSSVSTGHKREGSQLSSDLRSLQSTGSDSVRLREDSHSMLPLTGSLEDADGAMLDPESKEIVMKRLSQCEAGDETEEVEAGVSALDISTSLSDEPQHRELPQELEAHHRGKVEMMMMMESFVVTENKSEIEMAVQQALASHGDGADVVGVQVSVAEGDGDIDEDDGGVDDDAASVVVKDGGEDEYDDIASEVVSSPHRDNSVAEGGDENDNNTVVDRHPADEAQSSDPLHRRLPLSGADDSDGSAEARGSSPEHKEMDELVVTSESEEVAVTSEPEEILVTSEPELLDHGNTSSDGSDAAWDMVSDSEHVGEADGENDGTEKQPANRQ